jgi:orotate phosphoribosyltransferase
MSSLEDLIAKTKMLHSDGHSPSQIADELHLSMETITWLLTQERGGEAPKDVSIDYTAVSSDAGMLQSVARIMIERFESAILNDETLIAPEDLEVDAIVGISHSGVPLATLIAVEAATGLAIFHPAKHSTAEKPVGSVSGSFAAIQGKQCIIVDDVITTGKTLHEVVAYLRRHGAKPVAVWVIFDKRGIRDIEGVPVFPLFRISRID